MKTTNKLLMSSLLMISLQAFAVDGAGGGNGGDTVMNNGKLTILDLAEKDDLSYFDIAKETRSESGPDRDVALTVDYALSSTSFESQLEFLPYDFRDVMYTCMNKPLSNEKPLFYSWVKPLNWAFTKTPLKEIDDEGTILFADINSKKQLAIQKDGTVAVNESSFRELDQLNKNVLWFHEATICAVKAMNPSLIKDKGTAPVRKFIRSVVKWAKTKNEMDHIASKVAFEEMNIPQSTFIGSYDVQIKKMVNRNYIVPYSYTKYSCNYYVKATLVTRPAYLIVCQKFGNIVYRGMGDIRNSVPYTVIYDFDTRGLPTGQEDDFKDQVMSGALMYLQALMNEYQAQKPTT